MCVCFVLACVLQSKVINITCNEQGDIHVEYKLLTKRNM